MITKTLSFCLISKKIEDLFPSRGFQTSNPSMIINGYKEAPRESGIYKITSPTGKVYIGQSTNLYTRLRAYYCLYSFLKSQPKIYGSLQKHGINSHVFEIVELVDIGDLNERELYYKNLIVEELGWNATLFLRVDDNSSGSIHPDIRLKMRNAKLGGKLSDNTKEKISKAHVGTKKKYVSERNKILFKGRPPVNRKSINQYNLDGSLIKIFISIKEAMLCTGINPKQCLSGKCKTAGGYIWRYNI